MNNVSELIHLINVYKTYMSQYVLSLWRFLQVVKGHTIIHEKIWSDKNFLHENSLLVHVLTYTVTANIWHVFDIDENNIIVTPKFLAQNFCERNESELQ